MTDARPYQVRVTRLPLDPVKREKMRHEGTLPEDYRSRSVEAHDFVDVWACDDLEARVLARRNTRLAFKGEEALFHEVMNGDFRELHGEQDGS